MNLTDWRFSYYALPSLCATVAALAVLGLAWARRRAPGAPAFAQLVAATAVWSVLEAAILCAPDLPTKLLLTKFEYVGIVATPLAWLRFALLYCGQERWIRGLRGVLLAIIPLAMLGLVATLERHPWVYEGVELMERGSARILVADYGVGFVVFSIYSYLLITVATFVFLATFGQARPAFRGQMLAVVVAPLLTLAGNAVYLSKLATAPPIDLTPVGFTIGMVFMSLALYRWHFFELVPLARDSVIDGMPEGVVVVDGRGRLLDANRAMREILGVGGQSIVGRSAAEVLPEPLAQLVAVAPVVDAHEMTLEVGGETRIYDAVASPLVSHGGTVRARMVVMHDVSEKRRVARELEAFQEELRRANQELELLASTDPLTLLANRRQFWARLEAEIKRAVRHGESLALVMIDLDHFKRINDAHGHAVGDMVLKKVGALLASCVREWDMAARLGGEEFAVILPATDSDGAREVGERIRSRILEVHCLSESGVSVSTSASCGGAVLGPTCSTGDQLLAAADAALYRAKSKGRDRVSMDDTMGGVTAIGE